MSHMTRLRVNRPSIARYGDSRRRWCRRGGFTGNRSGGYGPAEECDKLGPIPTRAVKARMGIPV